MSAVPQWSGTPCPLSEGWNFSLPVKAFHRICRRQPFSQSLVQCSIKDGLMVEGTSWRYSPLIDSTNAVLCLFAQESGGSHDRSQHPPRSWKYKVSFCCSRYSSTFFLHIYTTFQSRWTESEILLFVLAQPVEQRHVRLLNFLVLFDASYF